MLDAWWDRIGSAAALVGDAVYNDRQRCPAEPRGVLIGCPPTDLAVTAACYNATAAGAAPLLMHAFLPGVPPVDFISAGLPRPAPILPLLIRRGVYTHHPGGPYPTTDEFLTMLTEAFTFKKEIGS